MSANVIEFANYRRARVGRMDCAGLTDQDFRAVVVASCTLPGAWFIERQEDRNGRTSVVLIPNMEEEQPQKPAYVLSRRQHSVVLHAHCNGQVRLAAEFHDIGAAIRWLRRLLCGAG
ncbi:MAG: hypothetical protein JOY71_03175 [Acetobacteraceae bacterium]|nr:hypothetical protein [Acetobacteraceae bacterium]